MNNININNFQWHELIQALNNQCEYLEEVANALIEVREELEEINNNLDKQDNQE